MKITFIGGGNMGRAMLSAVLDRGLSAPRDIAVSDVDADRLTQLEQQYGVFVTSSNIDALSSGDVVVLAVKPQNLADVMAEIGGRLEPRQLALSIIAGKKLETLRHGLGYDAIVRAMPNTPAQIGRGVTVWTATSQVSEKQRTQVAAILMAMGREIYVVDEGYLDMATVISGSGPAYLFLFMEALISAAVDIGLPVDIARELVLETVIGTAEFARKSGGELSGLRRMVTSTGGTTATALDVLARGRFAGVLKNAVAAAYDKARELGD
jgi:pyrroline-5-carboxylate reductase